MDLANMRAQGVHHLIAFCLNDACRHQALIEVSDYLDEVEILYVKPRVKCTKCGGRWVDVRPNWKEAPGSFVIGPRGPQCRPATSDASLAGVEKQFGRRCRDGAAWSGIRRWHSRRRPAVEIHARHRPIERGLMPRWRVDYLGSKGKHLGTVEAPDEKSAIGEAMKMFNITPARRFKIMVTKIETGRK
jgi:hypothetical protein